MKRLLYIFAAVTALCLASCTKELDEFGDDLHALELRVTQLEVQVQAAKSDIKALQILAKARDAATKITSLVPTAEGGFIISLSNGQSFTVNSGANGTDGVSAAALAIAKDTDGKWYWTVGGEWMLDASGAKCPVVGPDATDGVTPKLRINDGAWEVSIDGGATWTMLCEDRYAPSSLSIAETDESVAFTLADGSVITLGKVSPFYMSASQTDFTVKGGDTVKIAFTVKGGEDGYGVGVYFAPEGYTVSMDKKNSKITVSVAADAADGTVIVCAMKDSTGQVSAQSLSFTISE